MRRSSLTCAILLVGLTARAARADDQDPLFDCGRNSLHVLLELSGRRADLGAIERTLPSRHPAGYSMSELQASARALGLRLRGVRFGKRDAPLPWPAIAYMSNAGSGHFIVLRPVGLTGTMVQVIDPPFAPVITDYDRLIAGPGWTGRLLIPQTLADRLIARSWVSLPVAGLLLCLSPIRRRIRKLIDGAIRAGEMHR